MIIRDRDDAVLLELDGELGGADLQYFEAEPAIYGSFRELATRIGALCARK